MINAIKNAIPAVIALGGILATIAGIGWIVDLRIDAKVNSQSFRSELAKTLQSSIVFNGSGSILNDPSDISSEYIDKISVDWKNDEFKNVGHAIITIHFKRYIPIEPVLFCYETPIRSFGKRVDTFSWEFDVYGEIGIGPIKSFEDSSTRFLLTIVK